ncbi:MAG: A/G-specific adenine glycosylase [Bacteroidota bacterium]
MKISKILLEWYKKNARDLPWRTETIPYRTWISEIILQQTRVEQGLAYYHRFMKAFPDVEALASADEEEVLRQWQGLGYYSRARNMHSTAKQIVHAYGGEFPRSSAELRALKGIGPYTAAAMASIAFGEPVAAIDGNVIRVVSRLFAVAQPVNKAEGKKLLEQLAGEILDRESPGDFNQAMMELGALICTPRNPDCMNCPLNHNCQALESGSPAAFPVKEKKNRTIEMWLCYFHLVCGEFTILKRRTEPGIWQGLYDFPLLEADRPISDEELISFANSHFVIVPGSKAVLSENGRVRHQLSHRTLHIHFYTLEIPELPATLPPGWKVTGVDELHSTPFPVVIANYINKVYG